MPSRLVNFNGTLFFVANDGTFGYELWKSDGTTAGTQAVQAPDGSRSPEVAFGMWAASDRLFFGGRTLLYGTELFVFGETDYGDAVNQTTYAQNGARHIATGPRFGSLRDTSEANGLAGANANGDDTSGIDDEDLFASSISFIKGQPLSVSIHVAGATANTRVSGWFDWNQDGDWNDANEKVVDDAVVINGANPFSISVPASGLSGSGLSRWRISEQTGLTPAGWAFSGEVEDHPFTVVRPIALTLPSTSTNDIIIRKVGAAIQIVDRATATVLDSELLSNLTQISITGSDSQIDRVQVDYDAGGFFAIAGGISLNGRGGNDVFSINGTRNTALVHTDSTVVLGQSLAATTESIVTNNIQYEEFEAITFNRLASFDAPLSFQIGARSFTIDATGGVLLPVNTTIGGGALTSANTIELISDGLLKGNGAVTGDFRSGTGAKIQMTGDLSIGRATSNAGFTYMGTIDTAGFKPHAAGQ